MMREGAGVPAAWQHRRSRWGAEKACRVEPQWRARLAASSQAPSFEQQRLAADAHLPTAHGAGERQSSAPRSHGGRGRTRSGLEQDGGRASTGPRGAARRTASCSGSSRARASLRCSRRAARPLAHPHAAAGTPTSPSSCGSPTLCRGCSTSKGPTRRSTRGSCAPTPRPCTPASQDAAALADQALCTACRPDYSYFQRADLVEDTIAGSPVRLLPSHHRAAPRRP